MRIKYMRAKVRHRSYSSTAIRVAMAPHFKRRELGPKVYPNHLEVIKRDILTRRNLLIIRLTINLTKHSPFAERC